MGSVLGLRPVRTKLTQVWSKLLVGLCLLGAVGVAWASCADPIAASRDTVTVAARVDAAGWRVLTDYERGAEQAITDRALTGGDLAQARAELVAQRAKVAPASAALVVLEHAIEVAAAALHAVGGVTAAAIAPLAQAVLDAIGKARVELAALGLVAP